MIGQREYDSPVLSEPLFVRWLLIAIAFLFLTVFLILPLAAVFVEALEKGFALYRAAIVEPYTISAIKLTVVAALVAVFANMLFGLAAAWAITKFDFSGKSVLITLIDLPFAVSPVISGMVFVLLFGMQGYLGPWLMAHNIRIIFAAPGIILATIFVTFPFVARELIPLMKSQGKEAEEAALTLGAGGWQTFFRITLPNIKWALIYALIQCNARAMGEFGAVAVVSGHISGQTNTLPLHVEILYNEYNFTAAFAVASLLTFLAVLTLVLKKMLALKTDSASLR